MAQTPTQSNAIEEGTRWNLDLEDLPGVDPLGQTAAERDQVQALRADNKARCGLGCDQPRSSELHDREITLTFVQALPPTITLEVLASPVPVIDMTVPPSRRRCAIPRVDNLTCAMASRVANCTNADVIICC
jgi:hypothetical protein